MAESKSKSRPGRDERRTRPKRVKAKVAPAAPPSLPKPETVDVYSPDGRVFTERHADQPGGEVWIAGDGLKPSATVTVARTPGVEKAIRAGRLKEVPTRDAGATSRQTRDEAADE